MRAVSRNRDRRVRRDLRGHPVPQGPRARLGPPDRRVHKVPQGRQVLRDRLERKAKPDQPARKGRSDREVSQAPPARRDRSDPAGESGQASKYSIKVLASISGASRLEARGRTSS